MTFYDLLHELAPYKEEITEELQNLEKLDGFHRLDEITVFISGDIIYSTIIEDFYLGEFSTLALNFFVYQKLIPLFPLFENYINITKT